MTAYFITGTGTDIGKTFVTAGLIRHWRAVGRPVDARKPVVTGFDPAAAGSDPGVLLNALGQPITAAALDRIAPFRFAGAFAPDLAARREHRPLDFAALTRFCRGAADGCQGTLFTEGVGGVMVPLDARHTVLDWMADLNWPLVLVAGSYLGSISHTLTCVDAICRRGLAIKVLVVNETKGSTVSVADTIHSLTHFAGPIPVVALPHMAAGSDHHSAFAEITALL